MIQESGVRFLPWEPAGADPRFKGVRLLVLGESHYEEDDWIDDGSDRFASFTQEIVRCHGLGPQRRQVFFANLYGVLTGMPWSRSADFGAVWNSIFFYNYVQRLVPGGARNRPDVKMWEAGATPFRAILDSIRPEGVLVLGEALWQSMPDAELLADAPEALGRIYAYRLGDGTEVPAAHCHHPSAPGFSPSAWSPGVDSYLNWLRSKAGL